MEPLAGFFVLFGLIFDVAGAILIVSPIIFFKSKWKGEMWDVKQEFFNEKVKNINSLAAKVLSVMEGTKFIGNVGIIKTEADSLKKDAEKYQKQLAKDIEEQKKDYTESRAHSGLACLIGGFTMQAIGVVIQLVT